MPNVHHSALAEVFLGGIAHVEENSYRTERTSVIFRNGRQCSLG